MAVQRDARGARHGLTRRDPGADAPNASMMPSLVAAVVPWRQVVIATPGRLCELAFDRRRLRLSNVRTVVLDEVDALLKAPYDREIDAIFSAVPPPGKEHPPGKRLSRLPARGCLRHTRGGGRLGQTGHFCLWKRGSSFPLVPTWAGRPRSEGPRVWPGRTPHPRVRNPGWLRQRQRPWHDEPEEFFSEGAGKADPLGSHRGRCWRIRWGMVGLMSPPPPTLPHLFRNPFGSGRLG